MKRLLTRTLSVLLCLSLILGLGGRWTIPLPTEAASIDVGSNPRPKIDIAVNVPSDYPGTFLDFKEELAQKLIPYYQYGGNDRHHRPERLVRIRPLL